MTTGGPGQRAVKFFAEAKSSLRLQKGYSANQEEEEEEIKKFFRSKFYFVNPFNNKINNCNN